MKEQIKKQEDGSFVHEMEQDGQKLAVNFSVADIEKLVTAAIKAAKEPDEDTKAKLAEEKKQRENYMAQMLKMAREEEAARKAGQDRCSHKKQNGETRINAGQIYSDGKVRPICTWCQKVFAEYDAPRELVFGTGLS